MSFHRTYRPPTLDQIVGHKAVVTRLQGIIKSERYPSAMLFIGPSSAGKTTLARAFATDVNQLSGDIERSTDYKEVNAGADRSIEDIRNLVQNSKFMPSKKKRIIVIDEAQQLVSNAPAAAALLKPLEEPSKNTIWILCSMDADKFRNGNGKAIANRCTQFILEPHTEADLLKQALRIAKAEKMTYVMDEERTILKAIVANSNGEMRTLANQMEAAQQYYEGLSDRPKRLTVDMINNVLAAGSTEDEQTAGEILWALYNLQFKGVQRKILDVKDGIDLINKMLYMNAFLMNSLVLNGERHGKVWSNQTGYALAKKTRAAKISLGVFAAVHEMLVEVRSQAVAIQVSPADLLSARTYRLIKTLSVK